MNPPLSWVCGQHSGLGWGVGVVGQATTCSEAHLLPAAVQGAVLPAPYCCSSRSLGTVWSEVSGRGPLGLRSQLA